jgi:hypothetical protein
MPQILKRLLQRAGVLRVDLDKEIQALTLGSMHELTSAGHFDAVFDLMKAGGGADTKTTLRATEALIAILAHALKRDEGWIKGHVKNTAAWRLLGKVLALNALAGGGGSPNAPSPSPTTGAPSSGSSSTPPGGPSSSSEGSPSGT